MNKYEQALIRLAKAHAEVSTLSKSIAESMEKCPDYYTDRGLHQSRAYKETTDASYYDGPRRLTIEEVAEALSDDGCYLYCPACLATHLAVQERKAARKRLGHAKRALTIMGKALMKKGSDK